MTSTRKCRLLFTGSFSDYFFVFFPAVLTKRVAGLSVLVTAFAFDHLSFLGL